MVTFLVFTATAVTILIERATLSTQLTDGCEVKSGMIYELD